MLNLFLTVRSKIKCKCVLNVTNDQPDIVYLQFHLYVEYFKNYVYRDQFIVFDSTVIISVLCRMKMLPVMISANYHSSARSAVSESPNSSARLVSQCPNSSARLVSQCPNSSARLVSQCPNSSARLFFPMFQVELATRF